MQKKATKTITKAKKTTQVQTAVNALEKFKSLTLKNDIPTFKAGDKIVVKSKIKEGDKERIQAFEGIVIAKNGRGIQETFTIRKISAGVGVERVFPIHSPAIASIEVKVEGFIRRGKLYYLRKLDGRAARIRDKNLKLLESAGGASDSAASAATSESPASQS